MKHNETNKKFSLQFHRASLSFPSLCLQILRDAVLNFELVQNDLLSYDHNTKKNPPNFF